jgi:predicted ABC-type ATPase
LEKIIIAKKPLLIIIAGPNGSGKTTITKKILKHEWFDNCLYINPDDIAKEKFGDWNSLDAVIKAANFSTNLRNEALNERKNIIFETVFSSEEKIRFVLKAKELGYFIRFFFVGTDNPTINASRIAKRVMDGGHDVPISKIISRYSKSIVNCGVILEIVDRAYIYDNSKEDTNPILLFRATNGCLIKTYSIINNWASFIIPS